jgi:aspartyl-tRNA(Asn)/glutamyl-tRNA(Gln) amidotransferase subunit C
MSEINEKSLEHLLSLARIGEKDVKRRGKLLKDLSKILDYFNELKEVDTENVEPLSGGTFLTDIMRPDEKKYRGNKEHDEQREKSIEQFSRKENDYLKIPPVFTD